MAELDLDAVARATDAVIEWSRRCVEAKKNREPIPFVQLELSLIRHDSVLAAQQKLFSELVEKGKENGNS